jgi:hypothetical protein
MTTLDPAPEGSTYEVVLSYFDKTPTAMTPTSASWSLFDEDGNVINSQTAVSIASISTTNTIELAGSDLPYIATQSAVYLVVKMIYTSTLGAGRITYSSFKIPIEPVKGATW